MLAPAGRPLIFTTIATATLRGQLPRLELESQTCALSALQLLLVPTTVAVAGAGNRRLLASSEATRSRQAVPSSQLASACSFLTHYWQLQVRLRTPAGTA